MTRDAQDCARWSDALYPLAGRLTYFAPFSTRCINLPQAVRADLLAVAGDAATAWVVTSARAVAALAAGEAELLAALRTCLVFAVGEGTAAALHVAGFSHVVAADGDQVSLAALIALRAPQQGVTKLIHLAGSVTVADLAVALRQAPLDVQTHVVYEAVLNDVPPALADALSHGAITDVILLSARVAQHLGAAMRAQAGASLSAGAGPARLYCLSARIADAARAAFAPATPELLVASRPDVCAVLTMIDAPVSGLHNTSTDSALTE